MGLRVELAPRSFDDLERAEAKRLLLTLTPTSGKKMQLVLHQDASVGIAGVMYDCAALLARRLCEEPSLLGSKVVELGCGTGCAGLAAAALGAKVVLTDRSERALQIAQRSAKDTGLEIVTRRWEWHEPLPKECCEASTVLATDVVYSEDTSALLSALKAVAAPGTVVLLVVRVRSLAALAGLRSLLQGASHFFKECAPAQLEPAARACLQRSGKELALSDTHDKTTYFYRFVR
ncbi:eef1akmt3 [Symbiodinium natans]|uniref:Eef1akmt3 protein n=1 Tax=Symbiodinium natans TaxID=878477 RepID=A0A812TIB7_9DINO|nr:eef1akmt3 [Symbiodinium natans]